MTWTLRNLLLKIFCFRENGRDCFVYQLIFSPQKHWYFKYLPMTEKIFDLVVSGGNKYWRAFEKELLSIPHF